MKLDPGFSSGDDHSAKGIIAGDLRRHASLRRVQPSKKPRRTAGRNAVPPPIRRTSCGKASICTTGSVGRLVRKGTAPPLQSGSSAGLVATASIASATAAPIAVEKKKRGLVDRSNSET